jgi:hypothetical protein
MNARAPVVNIGKHNPYGALLDDDVFVPNPAGKSMTTTEVTHDKFCDGCLTDPFVGQRFSCNVCEDFDLCAGCFAKVGNGSILHDPFHRFEEQAPAVYSEDLHISEIVYRTNDFLEGIIFRRCDGSRLFYGMVTGLESDQNSSKIYLGEGEYITRFDQNAYALRLFLATL